MNDDKRIVIDQGSKMRIIIIFALHSQHALTNKATGSNANLKIETFSFNKSILKRFRSRF